MVATFRASLPIAAATVLLSFSDTHASSSKVASIEDCQATVPVLANFQTAGGGLSIAVDGSRMVIGPGTFGPYEFHRYEIPNGTTPEVLQDPHGMPLLARYISGNGDNTILAIESADAGSIDPSDNNGFLDIFRAEWRVGEAASITRISLTPSGGEANGDSEGMRMSPDGTKVAFTSSATNLVPNAPPRGVYIWDGQTSSIKLASSSTLCPGGELFRLLQFSADASRFLFSCYVYSVGNRFFEIDIVTGEHTPVILPLLEPTVLGADDNLRKILVSGYFDGSTTPQLFVVDQLLSAVVPISTRLSGGFPDREVSIGQISGDGRFVSFTTNATNIINEFDGLFLRSYIRDMETMALEVINGDGFGVPRAEISSRMMHDGRSFITRTDWFRFSDYDETIYSTLKHSNPFLCPDPSMWRDGFEP